MNFFTRLFKKEPAVVSDPDELPEALKQQAVVFDEIGTEAISCTPENWTNAVLVITCDGRRIDYSLKNHRKQEGKAVISQRLAQLAERLYSLMASHGNEWTRAELRYDQDEQGWRFESNFTYSETNAQQGAPADAGKPCH